MNKIGTPTREDCHRAIATINTRFQQVENAVDKWNCLETDIFGMFISLMKKDFAWKEAFPDVATEIKMIKDYVEAEHNKFFHRYLSIAA
jgi:hypothetical protein